MNLTKEGVWAGISLPEKRWAPPDCPHKAAGYDNQEHHLPGDSGSALVPGVDGETLTAPPWKHTRGGGKRSELHLTVYHHLIRRLLPFSALIICHLFFSI